MSVVTHFEILIFAHHSGADQMQSYYNETNASRRVFFQNMCNLQQLDRPVRDESGIKLLTEFMKNIRTQDSFSRLDK